MLADHYSNDISLGIVMLADFVPAHINIRKSFLKDIFGILGIKADCARCTKQNTLAFSEPDCKFHLLLMTHGAAPYLSA
jgi:hypothetical protein